MKKTILSALLVLVMSLTACANEKVISFSEMPQQAQQLIEQHFSKADVSLVMQERDGLSLEYEVRFNDGTKVEFDTQGEWKRVGRKKTGVPVKLIPPAITQYVKANYPDDVVSKLSRKPYGYKIELSSDKDLRFNPQGQFIEVID